MPKPNIQKHLIAAIAGCVLTVPAILMLATFHTDVAPVNFLWWLLPTAIVFATMLTICRAGGIDHKRMLAEQLSSARPTIPKPGDFDRCLLEYREAAGSYLKEMIAVLERVMASTYDPRRHAALGKLRDQTAALLRTPAIAGHADHRPSEGFNFMGLTPSQYLVLRTEVVRVMECMNFQAPYTAAHVRSALRSLMTAGPSSEVRRAFPASMSFIADLSRARLRRLSEALARNIERMVVTKPKAGFVKSPFTPRTVKIEDTLRPRFTGGLNLRQYRTLLAALVTARPGTVERSPRGSELQWLLRERLIAGNFKAPLFPRGIEFLVTRWHHARLGNLMDSMAADFKYVTHVGAPKPAEEAKTEDLKFTQ